MMSRLANPSSQGFGMPRWPRCASLVPVRPGAIIGDRFERSGRAKFDRRAERIANGQSDQTATSSIIDRHLKEPVTLK